MSKKKADYSHFVRPDGDGKFWWSIDDALKLAAGFISTSGRQRSSSRQLRALSKAVVAIHKRLMGALDDDRFAILQPTIEIRDGMRYVEARAFLEWLSQYLAMTQSDIPFPNDLVLAVKVAQQQISPTAPPLGFESLEVALEGWFDRSLAELPDLPRQRVVGEMRPMPWDDLTPENRRSVARQLDHQRDPGRAQRRQQSWDLRNEIAVVTAMPVATFDERERKKAQIAELERLLGAVEGGLRAALRAGARNENWSDGRLRALVDESREPGMTQAKLAAKHGISRQRISALLSQAKDKYGPRPPSLAEAGTFPRNVKGRKH